MCPPVDVAARLAELAPGHGPILAAVSGGSDSTALAVMLQRAGVAFEIASFDHSLRTESAADVEFVRELAAELGVPMHAGRADVRVIAADRGWNLEEAARRLRYDFLTRTARACGATHVVTAHTRDDQVETVLMQLLRGAAWLRGMAAARGRVLRPLLDTPKATLVAWLRSIEREWREDATNLDPSWQRAWLRQEILPALRARHPEADARIFALAGLQRDQAAFVRAAATRLLAPGDEHLDAVRLSRQPVALQREALALLLARAGAGVDLQRIERVRERLAAPHPYRESLGAGAALRVAYGRVEVTGDSGVAAPQFPLADPVGSVAVTDPAQLPDGVSTAVLELPDLQLRGRRPGDRIRLAGGTRKVSDVLIDARVPREQRDSLAVLASGRDVLWIEGVAVAHGMRAGDAAVAQPGDIQSQERRDRRFMQLALAEAGRAASLGELPVGAVVVRGQELLAAAHNETEQAGDPSAHAEVLAIRRAAAALGNWRLGDCSLYVTLEPCPMCFGAMQQAHLPEVVYAASNVREGAFGGVADVDLLPWKRRISARRGPLAEESAALLREFFARRR